MSKPTKKSRATYSNAGRRSEEVQEDDGWTDEEFVGLHVFCSRGMTWPTAATFLHRRFQTARPRSVEELIHKLTHSDSDAFNSNEQEWDLLKTDSYCASKIPWKDRAQLMARLDYRRGEENELIKLGELDYILLSTSLMKGPNGPITYLNPKVKQADHRGKSLPRTKTPVGSSIVSPRMVSDALLSSWTATAGSSSGHRDSSAQYPRDPQPYAATALNAGQNPSYTMASSSEYPVGYSSRPPSPSSARAKQHYESFHQHSGYPTITNPLNYPTDHASESTGVMPLRQVPSYGPPPQPSAYTRNIPGTAERWEAKYGTSLETAYPPTNINPFKSSFWGLSGGNTGSHDSDAFFPGTTAAMAASLPGANQSLMAPSPTSSGGFGAGYSGTTGGASAFGGGYGSTSYPSTQERPGYPAGSQTDYRNAGVGYLSLGQTFQGSGQSAYSSRGHMSPPRWPEDPEEDDFEQELSDPQPQKTRKSQQAPPRRQWHKHTEEEQDAIRRGNQDKRIAKFEGLKRQKEETQQRKDAKVRSQAGKRDQARAQARQAAEEGSSAGQSSDGDPENDPSSRQPRKRRRAQHDESRSRSRSQSRLERLAKRVKLPEKYHGWPRDDVIKMAVLIARAGTRASLDQKFAKSPMHYYNKYMLPDSKTWGWVEIERVKHLKAMGKEGNRRLGSGGRALKERGQQQKR